MINVIRNWVHFIFYGENLQKFPRVNSFNRLALKDGTVKIIQDDQFNLLHMGIIS